MNNITDVQNGLHNHLLTLSDLPSKVAVENERFKPNMREDYLRTTLLPSATTKESLGLNGFNRLNGLYQIDIFTPAGRKNIQSINEMADIIVNGFVTQIVINENLTNIRVMDVWRDTSISESDWFRLPVVVRWESYQTR